MHAQHDRERSDRQRWLRTSLLANAAFSTLSGLTFALAGGPVASYVGLEQAWLVRAVGVGLLGFAGFVGYVATRSEIDLRESMAIIVGDLGWVAGTVPVVLMGWLSSHGTVAALVIADIVLIFAGLQYYGVRRIRAQSPAARPQTA